eukprot:gnl/TRDRNA2_/TRDRNA2_36501_c0_seq1.p1 gnl/TRDRNA2_/TRDRNA2_36501_c0~~gnl/TRDRNA2_/TRDRNA2_36501_c0_seq1.p1  ORF type:complete len:533 (+),score=40.57 gnl/TRDRNA2_/TRDRNA2_36501_c0_seq1:88-1686(+)
MTSRLTCLVLFTQLCTTTIAIRLRAAAGAPGTEQERRNLPGPREPVIASHVQNASSAHGDPARVGDDSSSQFIVPLSSLPWGSLSSLFSGLERLATIGPDENERADGDESPLVHALGSLDVEEGHSTWFLENRRQCLVVLVIFVFVASLTIIQELVKAPKTDSRRKATWDIAKFILSCMVIGGHVCPPARLYWESWCLPCFFILSGICGQSEDDVILSANVLLRLLRDNVLNNIIFIIMVTINPYHDPEGGQGLWYLWALATYRLTIRPCWKALTGMMGYGPASSALLMGTVVLPWVVGHFFGPYRQYAGNFVLDATLCHGMFYALGLMLHSETIHHVVHSGPAFAVGLLTVMGWDIWYIRNATLKQDFGDSVGCCAPMRLYSSPKMPFHCFAVQGGARAILSLCFLCCVYPLCLDAIRNMRRLLASLGERTLYVYYVSMFFIFGVTGRTNLVKSVKPFWTGSWQPLVWIGVVFVTAALASPLSECLFNRVVSPSWMLDGSNTWGNQPASPSGGDGVGPLTFARIFGSRPQR